jgi:RimJ/RimL family protein N-acetyltransferase
MKHIRIEPATRDHAEAWRECLDQVARERKYLAMLEAPGLQDIRAFIDGLNSGAGFQLLALASDGTVMGWCDIFRMPQPGFTHCGRLGMGVAREYRRHGLGRQLLLTAIEKAGQIGLTRIELDVFASNRAAIHLYETAGFAHEGVKRGAREIDGLVDDVVLMALHPQHSAP